jgi:hypothetical protein
MVPLIAPFELDGVYRFGAVIGLGGGRYLEPVFSFFVYIFLADSVEVRVSSCAVHGLHGLKWQESPNLYRLPVLLKSARLFAHSTFSGESST